MAGRCPGALRVSQAALFRCARESPGRRAFPARARSHPLRCL